MEPINIKYPQKLREGVERSVEAWKKFCELPEEIRLKFPYNPENGMGVGYELKKVPGATLDIKEDFHITKAANEWLMGKAKETNEPAVVEFVTSAGSLVDLMIETVSNFASQLEENYKIQGFAKEITSNSDQWFLRFIHYFGGSIEGEEIAKAHTDKSAFTLHLFESDSGLQYLDDKFVWKAMPVSSGETAIIPGMRGQYMSQGKLKAVFHRVVATKKTAKNGRFSAVVFIHPGPKIPQYNKASMGRLQEFKPGFNYEMPFGEFATLFKSSSK